MLVIMIIKTIRIMIMIITLTVMVKMITKTITIIIAGFQCHAIQNRSK